jgi:hypothetical protein
MSESMYDHDVNDIMEETDSVRLIRSTSIRLNKGHIEVYSVVLDESTECVCTNEKNARFLFTWLSNPDNVSSISKL